MRVFRPASSIQRAFSLVELLLVMTVIVILIAVAGPALRGLLGSDNRKAAVNQLMGALEQARVTALEKGTTVYVGFAAADFTAEPSWQFTRYIMFRSRSNELDGKPAVGGVQPRFVLLSRWQTLPIGAVLTDFGGLPRGGELINVDANDQFPPVTDSSGQAVAATSFKLRALAFNSTGVIGASVSGADLASGLFVTQGFYAGGQLRETRPRSASSAKLQYDRISFARYTGRARFDVAMDPR